mgnify:CR=1 FL=1
MGFTNAILRGLFATVALLTAACGTPPQISVIGVDVVEKGATTSELAVRLEIQNRHDEIEVVKLVGGTDAFIRRPFLYEGIWYGLLGAAIAGFLVFKQLGMVFGWPQAVTWTLLIVSVAAYGLYCRSLGRPILLFLCLIMMPLATTELGTDGAISGIMEEPLHAIGANPLWVLIYTSSIMMCLRFVAGPIVHKLTPLGLLAVCATLACAGLFLLSKANGLAFIFLAATIYGVGKSFFWPTMLGVVAEQTPKGGALTLNAIAGIGMLTVGILGGPLIGEMQERSIESSIEAKTPGAYQAVSKSDSYFFGTYRALDPAKLSALPEAQSQEISTIAKTARQGSLAKVIVFPAFMLVCYLGLIVWFRSRGGYKAVSLSDSHG